MYVEGLDESSRFLNFQDIASSPNGDHTMGARERAAQARMALGAAKNNSNLENVFFWRFEVTRLQGAVSP